MTIGYEQTYQLRTGDFDSYAHLLPSSILDVFQDVAGVNAEQVPGMTWKELTDAGLFWVVTRIKYEVIETPHLHEQVIARTWPLAPTRLGFQREYTMRKLDGTPLVKCSSDWILMDYKTRSFASARDFYNGPQDFSEEKVFEKKLRKIKTFEPEDAGETFQVHFVDIDINGHVNNSKYPNFVMNSLDLSEDETIKTFQIDYRHELRAGSTVRIHSKREENVITSMGISTEGDTAGECMFATQIELA